MWFRSSSAYDSSRALPFKLSLTQATAASRSRPAPSVRYIGFARSWRRLGDSSCSSSRAAWQPDPSCASCLHDLRLCPRPRRPGEPLSPRQSCHRIASGPGMQRAQARRACVRSPPARSSRGRGPPPYPQRRQACECGLDRAVANTGRSEIDLIELSQKCVLDQSSANARREAPIPTRKEAGFSSEDVSSWLASRSSDGDRRDQFADESIALFGIGEEPTAATRPPRSSSARQLVDQISPPRRGSFLKNLRALEFLHRAAPGRHLPGLVPPSATARVDDQEIPSHVV